MYNIYTTVNLSAVLKHVIEISGNGTWKWKWKLEMVTSSVTCMLE